MQSEPQPKEAVTPGFSVVLRPPSLSPVEMSSGFCFAQPYFGLNPHGRDAPLKVADLLEDLVARLQQALKFVAKHAEFLLHSVQLRCPFLHLCKLLYSAFVGWHAFQLAHDHAAAHVQTVKSGPGEFGTHLDRIASAYEPTKLRFELSLQRAVGGLKVLERSLQPSDDFSVEALAGLICGRVQCLVQIRRYAQRGANVVILSHARILPVGFKMELTPK